MSGITPRWTQLRMHKIQQQYWNSPHRFNTVPAGRRSGKTELLKRKIIIKALEACTPWAPRFFVGAPVRDQAKRIYWEDLKLLSPPEFVVGKSETEMMIEYINGATVWVIGLDKPERMEGQPWDGGGLDEFANMKAGAWGENVRPALSDRLGWCDLIGVPEGRNHYYDVCRRAKAEMQAKGAASEWGYYTWPSKDILPPSEIESAQRDLDPQTFDQEYNASFVNFSGRAYYQFTEDTHCAPLKYDPKQALILCFDFNVDPGVCAYVQEQVLPGQFEHDAAGVPILNKPITGTGVIGEVHIPRNSNTPAVCRRIITDMGTHTGAVRCYGDTTGGNRGTAKVDGSDWDLIRRDLGAHFKQGVDFRVKTGSPRERSRINAMNSRMKSTVGDIRLMVDGAKAPNVVKDFEGVALLEGGSGEVDKKKDKKLSHISDAISYYVEYEFPVAEKGVILTRIGGF